MRRIVVALAVLAVAGSAGHANATSSHTSLASPVWSPDGSKLAWVSSTLGFASVRVWVAAADGSGAHAIGPEFAQTAGPHLAWDTPRSLIADQSYGLSRLADTGFRTGLGRVSNLWFSLDHARTQIATGSASCPYCHGQAEIRDLQTGAVTQLGRASEQNENPSFSPDGRSVAYSRTACRKDAPCDTMRGIWIWPSGKKLAPTGICPAWSPDGKAVAYLSLPYIDASEGELRLVSVAGGKSTLLAGHATCYAGAPPSWSPDSRRVAFNDSHDRLAIADVKTGKIVRTAGTLGSVDDFSWSPDGKQLAVAAGRDLKCWSIYRIAAATGHAELFHACRP